MPDRISTGILPFFSAALGIWAERGPEGHLAVDFSRVQKAFANGMLGVIAKIEDLRHQGVAVVIMLPSNPIAREFFFTTNWANLLDPVYPRAAKRKKNHFVQHFTRFGELSEMVNNFMDVVLRYIYMPRDIQSALEWSVNEICDNVINHAQAGSGGYMQVIAYPQNDLIAFTVADAGRGILHSLKEGHPTLKDDIEAIEAAMKAGVTRNPEKGQGNGLAGTSRIASMTGGTLDILSGGGRILLEGNSNKAFFYGTQKEFTGTCVSAQIMLHHKFSIIEALTFGAVPYTPYTIVDQKYELPDEDALKVVIGEHEGGTGTRASGAELHIMMLNLMEAKPGYPVYLEWQGIEVVASSFADEFLGKLYLKIGKDKFDATIKNMHVSETVLVILSKAIAQRAGGL